MALEYISEGVDITDEVVAITTATTLDGNAVYIGRISNLAGDQVIGDDDPTYGIWTTATGTVRRTVITAGIPAAGEILWELQTGKLYSASSETVYLTYRAYADLRNEGRVYQIDLPILPDYTTTTDMYIVQCPWRIKFGEYQISCTGYRPDATAISLQLRTAVSGAGSTTTLALAFGSTSSGWTTISGGLAFTPSDYIVIRGDAANETDVVILLREALE